MTTADDGHVIAVGGRVAALSTNHTPATGTSAAFTTLTLVVEVPIAQRAELQALVNRFQLHHRTAKRHTVEILC